MRLESNPQKSRILVRRLAVVPLCPGGEPAPRRADTDSNSNSNNDNNNNIHNNNHNDNNNNIY